MLVWMRHSSLPGRTRRLGQLAIAVLALSTALAGCHKRQTGTGATPSAAAPAESAAPGAQAAARVEVEMTDHGINMPGNLMPGPTLFVIKNSGKVHHRFALERGEEVQQIDQALDPGEQGQLRADLLPGTYRVYCTYKEHPELPKQLVVTARVTR